MRAAVSLLVIFLCALPGVLSAEELNAGFVHGLWYSKEPIFEGETVRIYAALRNNTEHDITATVRLYDNDTQIAVRQISALPGRLVEAWADWTATYGEHTLRAQLADVKIHAIGKAAEAAEVVSMLAEDLIVIDYDTDSDGTGDTDDTDDDGDGASDEEERERGTDPLTYDKPDPEEEAVSEDDATQTAEKETPISSAAEISREGFERFTDEGAVDSVLTEITKKVAKTKQSLDAYRSERSKLRESRAASPASTSTPPEAKATITRSKIAEEHPGIIGVLLNGITKLFSGLYTLLLFILSKMLAHPALIQLALLLFILFASYRIARYIGRRQYY